MRACLSHQERALCCFHVNRKSTGSNSTCTCTCTRARTRTRSRTCTRTHISTRASTRAHAHAHAYLASPAPRDQRAAQQLSVRKPSPFAPASKHGVCGLHAVRHRPRPASVTQLGDSEVFFAELLPLLRNKMLEGYYLFRAEPARAQRCVNTQTEPHTAHAALNHAQPGGQAQARMPARKKRTGRIACIAHGPAPPAPRSAAALSRSPTQASAHALQY